MGKYNVGEVWWIHFPYGDSKAENLEDWMSDSITILMAVENTLLLPLPFYAL